MTGKLDLGECLSLDADNVPSVPLDFWLCLPKTQVRIANIGMSLHIFSLHRPSGLIQSLSRNVRMSCVCACLCVPSQKNCFPVDWRHLVEERIANIGIPLDISSFCRFDDFLRFEIVLGF